MNSISESALKSICKDYVSQIVITVHNLMTGPNVFFQLVGSCFTYSQYAIGFLRLTLANTLLESGLIRTNTCLQGTTRNKRINKVIPSHNCHQYKTVSGLHTRFRQDLGNWVCKMLLRSQFSHFNFSLICSQKTNF